jgi:hypothetical protein
MQHSQIFRRGIVVSHTMMKAQDFLIYESILSPPFKLACSLVVSALLKTMLLQSPSTTRWHVVWQLYWTSRGSQYKIRWNERSTSEVSFQCVAFVQCVDHTSMVDPMHGRCLVVTKYSSSATDASHGGPSVANRRDKFSPLASRRRSTRPWG